MFHIMVFVREFQSCTLYSLLAFSKRNCTCFILSCLWSLCLLHIPPQCPNIFGVQICGCMSCMFNTAYTMHSCVINFPKGRNNAKQDDEWVGLTHCQILSLRNLAVPKRFIPPIIQCVLDQCWFFWLSLLQDPTFFMSFISIILYYLSLFVTTILFCFQHCHFSLLLL